MCHVARGFWRPLVSIIQPLTTHVRHPGLLLVRGAVVTNVVALVEALEFQEAVQLDVFLNDALREIVKSFRRADQLPTPDGHQRQTQLLIALMAFAGVRAPGPGFSTRKRV